MRGRKPQPLPLAQAYAMIPQFMYALLSAGTITPAAFALWATIRLFARDQVRNTFSPGPVVLTTTQLAELTGLGETQVKYWLKELEVAEILKRETSGGNSRLVRKHTMLERALRPGAKPSMGNPYHTSESIQCSRGH